MCYSGVKEGKCDLVVHIEVGAVAVAVVQHFQPDLGERQGQDSQTVRQSHSRTGEQLDSETTKSQTLGESDIQTVTQSDSRTGTGPEQYDTAAPNDCFPIPTISFSVSLPRSLSPSLSLPLSPSLSLSHTLPPYPVAEHACVGVGGEALDQPHRELAAGLLAQLLHLLDGALRTDYDVRESRFWCRRATVMVL
jgi:hypothetical protein